MLSQCEIIIENTVVGQSKWHISRHSQERVVVIVLLFAPLGRHTGMAHNHPCIVGDRKMELMSGQGPFINAQTALAVIGNPCGVNSSFFTLYGQDREHAGLLAAIKVMAVVHHSEKTAHQISASSSTGSLT